MPRSRKWLITINNPIEHGFDHARIKAAVLDLPSVVYWCMCDEQGGECETLHTMYILSLKISLRIRKLTLVSPRSIVTLPVVNPRKTGPMFSRTARSSTSSRTALTPTRTLAATSTKVLTSPIPLRRVERCPWSNKASPVTLIKSLSL